jgi:hypothetical protein
VAPTETWRCACENTSKLQLPGLHFGMMPRISERVFRPRGSCVGNRRRYIHHRPVACSTLRAGPLRLQRARECALTTWCRFKGPRIPLRRGERRGEACASLSASRFSWVRRGADGRFTSFCQSAAARLSLAGARTRSSISTVAVMPAASTTPGGTSSIWMRTGMRWARRTQVKIGLTVATP